MTLIPFVIRWMDETHFAALPTSIYGLVLALSAIAYLMLERSIIECNGPDSKLARAVGSEVKGKVSLFTYVLASLLAFVQPWIALGLYVLIAMMWFVPDRRIESVI
jgi:uncharacterized membrane protein